MYFETENSKFFLKTIKALYLAGAMDSLILIGSWCLPFYRVHFETNDVPIKRTMDIDFLIPRPPRVTKEINIPEILSGLKFRMQTSTTSGYTKFLHPELEVEFLAPELGKGVEEPFKVPKLHIEAPRLRYLNLIQAHTIWIAYEDMRVRVPEPTVYALHKYILSTIRNRTSKKAGKDLETAQELTVFLLRQKDQVEKFIFIFESFPKKWQKKLKIILKAHDQKLLDALIAPINP